MIYIKLNEQQEIIQAFSTDFTQPSETDILYSSAEVRHVGEHFPELINLIDMETRSYKLKWINNAIYIKTQEELNNSIENQNRLLNVLRYKRNLKLEQIDIEIYKKEDDGLDVSDLRLERKRLRDLTESFKLNLAGILIVNIDELVGV